MTDITVNLDPETGAATIELRGAAVAEARFRLRDAATEKFLTRRGWSKTPSYLPGEGITVADFTALALDGELARRIPPGAKLILEQPTSNIFANLAWPGEAANADAVQTADAEDDTARLAPVAEPPSDEMQDAADASAKAWSEDAAVVPDTVEPDTVEPETADTEAAAPAIAAASGDDAAPDDAPQSLEPSIRDETVTPFRVDPPVSEKPVSKPATAEPVWGRKKAVDDADEDEDDAGRPWAKLAAAALVFMLLGSVLTYFWQSSAYDNELRIAMRAVEAQRDQQKAEFDKQLAAAQTDAGKTDTQAATAADAKVASLTDQTVALASERDEARAELSQQQAAVKTLQERLSTAQGEIESLKAATEADATEQTAVFNERIAALGKELDTARNELEANRAQLSERDRAATAADEELKKAKDEIAALTNSVEEQRVAQGQELEERIKALSAQLDKSAQDLASRDQTLRDVQAKLSVANVQIEALKQVAGKATSADLERTTLADRITELTTQIDDADKALAAKDGELREAKTSLDAANALLASNAAELKKLKGTAAASSEPRTQDASALAQLREERDLYAKELSTMTESLKSLKAERDRLAQAAGNPEQQAASLDAGAGISESRAIWGATAIDQTGAIYSLQNQTAEKTAGENAVALCRGKSNGRCEQLRTYSNSCFSLARIEGEGPRNDNFGFAVAKNWKSAESSAIRQCEELGGNCTVRFTACSPDGLSKSAANQ